VSAALDAVVTGVGAVTPVGLFARAACAALRAGIARIGEIETAFVDGELMGGVRPVGGRVPTERFGEESAPDEWPGHERFGVPPPPSKERVVAPGPERLVELALPAAREAAAEAGLAGRPGLRVGLYLGLDSAEDPSPIVAALEHALDLSVDPVVPVRAGRAAALCAAAAALDDLRGGRAAVALVGGADSLIRGPVLERLADAGIVRSASAPQGIIPGEAAAFFCVETARGALARGARVLCRLLAAAVGQEPTAGTREPNRGEGLTAVVRAAWSGGGGGAAPPFVVCDLNGDRYRAMEWAMASVRTVGRVHGDMEIFHPADCIGDCGAASGALALVWAAVAFAKGYAPAERALVWGASDGAERAALLLAPPG